MNNTNDAAGRLVFMLGTTPNTRLLEEVGQESAEHGDIVQGDLLDTYRNLTYKSVMGHLWVSEFCRQAELVVKADDDIYVDLYGALSLATRLRKGQKAGHEMFMMGIVNRLATEVIRSPDHPWSKWLGKPLVPLRQSRVLVMKCF